MNRLSQNLDIFQETKSLIVDSRRQLVKAVNSAMVLTQKGQTVSDQLSKFSLSWSHYVFLEGRENEIQQV